MASQKSENIFTSDAQIRTALESILLTRPVKEVSRETGFSEAAINKWKVIGLPRWIVDGFILTVKNTRVWAEAKRLRMIEEAAELDREIARLQALRRSIVHGSRQGDSRVAVSRIRRRLNGDRAMDHREG